MPVWCVLVLLCVAGSASRAGAQGLGQAAESERKRREALVYYHAKDEFGWEYWVFVIDYPADYVRRQASFIRGDFPMSSLLPYESNDTRVQAGSQLAGREIQVLWGRRSQVVSCLVGTRYYHLMAKPAPGEYFDHRELHPFIKSFRPGPG